MNGGIGSRLLGIALIASGGCATPSQPSRTETPAAVEARPAQPPPQHVKQAQIRPAIPAQDKFGTVNIANVAVDARWNTHAAYLQRLLATVQIQWERILNHNKIQPPVGSRVVVKFVVNDEGKIARISDVESNAGQSAARACVSAITDRAPYGPWTDDMKAQLGEQQEMTFTFFFR